MLKAEPQRLPLFLPRHRRACMVPRQEHRHIPGRPSPSRVVKLAPPAAQRVRESGYPEPVRAVTRVNGRPIREPLGCPQVLVTSVVGGASWGRLRSRKGTAARRRPLRFWLPTPNEFQTLENRFDTRASGKFWLTAYHRTPPATTANMYADVSFEDMQAGVTALCSDHGGSEKQ